MKKATYKQIPALLKARQSFEGSSLWAVATDDGYKVYSYQTLIYREYKGQVVRWNTHKYSSTTSRQQNIIKRVFGLGDKDINIDVILCRTNADGKAEAYLNPVLVHNK